MANEANFLRVYNCLLQIPFQPELQERETSLFKWKTKQNLWLWNWVCRCQDYLSAASGSASALTSALDEDPRNLLGSYRNNRKLSVWFVKAQWKKIIIKWEKRNNLEPNGSGLPGRSPARSLQLFGRQRPVGSRRSSRCGRCPGGPGWRNRRSLCHDRS